MVSLQNPSQTSPPASVETFAVLKLVQSAMPSVLLRQVLASSIVRWIIALPVCCYYFFCIFAVLSPVWNGTFFGRRSV